MKQIILALLMITGLAYFFSNSNSLEWYYFFIIIVGSVFISELIFINNPNKNKRPKTLSKKQNYNMTITKSLPKKKKTDLEIIHTPLDKMNGTEFERLVTLYFDAKGYKPQLIGGSGDHEVDIVLTDPVENYKIAVQCKHWKTKKVGNDVILRISSGKRVHKCIDAWCITTNYYTKAAMEAADANKVRLWNGLHVHNKIVKWQETKRKNDN